jgi:replicative DNA helicase
MTSLALAPLPSETDPEVNSLPHNLEAEQAILGALLFDNQVTERLSDKLSGKHFYEPFHQRLFDAIEEHVRQGLLAEPNILVERFRRDAGLRGTGRHPLSGRPRRPGPARFARGRLWKAGL